MADINILSKAYGFVGRVFATEDSYITNSFFTNGTVRNIVDPVDSQDPVTLGYLQRFVANFAVDNIIQLQGNEWIDIKESVIPWCGNFHITVNAFEMNAPNSQWQIARANNEDQGMITQGVFAPSNADCVLQLRWLPQSLVQIRKTTNQFDGNYKIKVL